MVCITRDADSQDETPTTAHATFSVFSALRNRIQRHGTRHTGNGDAGSSQVTNTRLTCKEIQTC